MEIINNNCDTDDELPSGITFKILIWLPVKSLLRFKSVSKSWRSLIESSEFITQHRLVYHHRHPTSFKQGNRTLFHLPRCFPSKYGHNGYPGLLSVDKFEKLDLPMTRDPFKIHRITMVSYCDGIICLLQNRTVCLWNPATKQSTNLPPLPVPPVYSHFGLGFDAKTNDYKVVCLNFRGIIHVCSLSSDYWRTITDVVLPELWICDYSKATEDSEICCWLGTTRVICWFNFTDEVFGTIPLPESSREMITTPSLAFLRGNIACFGKVGDNPAAGRSQSWYLEIWMLTEFPVKESWIKLYAIGPFHERWERLGAFSKYGDFVSYLHITDSNNCQPCLYDLTTSETVSLPIQVCCDFKVILYEESLISVRRGNGAMNRVICSDHNEGSSNNCCEINMPESVVFHILLWLPVISLLRFKSVCKSWLSIINNSKFISQHLHRSQYLILLSNHIVQLFEDPNLYRALSLSSYKFELLEFPVWEGCQFGSTQIMASCNGIICLRHASGPSYTVYLWNPATKQVREILEESANSKLFIGLGFYIKSNGYKLVRFDGLDSDSGIHVYNLSNDSWKIIDDDDVGPTVCKVGLGLKTPYRNTIHCSLGSVDPVNFTRTILSFDFSTEVLEIIPLPTIIAPWNGSSNWLQLTICRENICCISSTKILENENSHVELWMMNEYAVKDSWTKLYTVEDFSENWYPLVWSSKIGESILLLKDGQVCFCDLVSRETKSLPVQVRLPESQVFWFCYGITGIVMYKESLVSVNGGNYA